jgi:serine/threonine protein kinase
MAADDVPLAHEARTAPEQIGPYRILQLLGRGGMGTVYLAERADGAFQHKVALKLLRAGLDSPGAEARFRAERQILADLRHPNIARLVDGGAVDDGSPYLVMEYVEGRPIDRWCDEQRLDLTGRIELFREVCAAVQAATAASLSTGTSSQPTSSSPPMATPSCWISASPSSWRLGRPTTRWRSP